MPGSTSARAAARARLAVRWVRVSSPQWQFEAGGDPGAGALGGAAGEDRDALAFTDPDDAVGAPRQLVTQHKLRSNAKWGAFVSMISARIRLPGVEAGRSTGRLVFAIAESAVTAMLSLCWLLLSLAMYMESYDLDPSAAGQPRGQAQLAWLAVGALASIGLTRLLRISRKSNVRLTGDGLIALRLLVVVVVTGFLTVDLLDG